MPQAARSQFASFELDPETGELWQDGTRAHLQEKPFQLLTALLERPGSVVSREELRSRLWPDHTFVDFDHSINVAVSKLRETLGDSAETPEFIETLPKRGYRFIAPVTKRHPGNPAIPGRSSWARRALLAMLFLVLLLVAKAAWRKHPVNAPASGDLIRSIAVLPFENISQEPAQEYLADGVTVAVIGELGKIQALRVISWQSVVQFKSSDVALPEIAYLLNVDAIVSGNLVRSGDRVRVGIQLLATNPERHLWAETYEQDLGELLDMQQQVARAVASAIRVAVTPEERTRLADARPVVAEAYDAYLKGLYHWNHFSPESQQRAIEYYREAIALDPGYAAAHSALADAWSMLAWYGYVPPKQGFPLAEVAARRALELDPKLAAAHNSVAAVLYCFRWEFAAADQHHQRAIELNPSFSLARNWYSWSLADQGRHEEALEQIRIAQHSDPLSVVTNGSVGIRLYDAGRYEEAVRQFLLTLEMNPRFFPALLFLGMAYQEVGRFDESIAVFTKALEASGGQPIYQAALATSIATAGRQEEAASAAAQLLRRAEKEHVPAFQMATLFIALGQHDEAIDWLERALENRSPWMCRLPIDPLLDPIRADHRFDSLLRRTGRPARAPAVDGRQTPS